ncbi:MAG TPA: HPr-rel-A system PqqD family peptide chaperone [Rubrivivax sp.]|nr:HPr-rel-A system PqqD family peptide chaperone [Rubrivivax sp.]
MRYRLARGVRVEPLADTWAAFSALSGDTLQLNAEAAAVLELLAEGPMDDSAVCQVLAGDTQTDAAEVAQALSHVWDELLLAGLLRVDAGPAHNPG